MSQDQDHLSGAVVVGYDGSDAAGAAVGWAATQAELTGVRLELLSAWEYPTSWGNVVPLPNDFDPAADARTMLDAVVARLATEHPGLPVGSHVLEGRAEEVLVQASLHASLLVVASRGHGTFSGLLLGSVGQHCATHAQCPVLVHRHPSEA